MGINCSARAFASETKKVCIEHKQTDRTHKQTDHIQTDRTQHMSSKSLKQSLMGNDHLSKDPVEKKSSPGLSCGILNALAKWFGRPKPSPGTTAAYTSVPISKSMVSADELSFRASDNPNSQTTYAPFSQ
jgi:hypothetical protein